MNKTATTITALLTYSIVLLSTTAFAGSVYDTFPEEIDPSGTYLIYSHGKILEGNSQRPKNKRWGTYLFPEIRKALVDSENWILIGEHRSADTEVKVYSDKLVGWVQRLLKAGVKAENITLIGFSKGGIITTVTSSKLKKYNVNTILTASCWGRSKKNPDLKVAGNILSIYEASDSAKSCDYLVDEGAKSFQELEISTGKEHGAFYQPLDEWVVPLKDWIRSRGNRVTE